MYDQLFAALAQARSQPSHALRAVESAGQAGQDVLGGYLEGKDIKQKLDQYKTLNTRLGDIFPADSIPGGLTPDHTVGQLMQLAPILPYTRSPMADSIANELSGAPQSSGTQTTSVPTQAPAPTIASTDMGPIPGSETPSPTPGTSMLNSDEGTGVGSGGNLPAGTPIPVMGGGNSPTPSQPIQKPFNGMSYMDLQRYGPYLNDIRQARQFQQGQASENERARLTREQAERNFQIAQQNEKNRTMAGETAKIAPSLTEAGTIQDDINAMRPLFKGYSPVPFMGTKLANLTAASGSSTFGSPTMQAGKAIEQITPALSAKVNYLLNKRFNSGEASMLQAKVVPNASDDEGNFNQKVGNLQRLTSVMQGGDLQALRMVASSIAGQQVNPTLPTSGNISSGSLSKTQSNIYASESDVPSNLPKGTIITVNGRRAVIR